MVGGNSLKGLNEEQRQAVEHGAGASLVLAGAGSGKTRVLITRIAHLVHQRRALPEEIVAITFTNKAAREMKDRLRPLLGKRAKDVTLSTFHSLGMRILRDYTQELGYGAEPQLLGEQERISLLMNIARRRWPKNVAYKIQDLSMLLAELKEKGIPPQDCPSDTPFGNHLPRIYKEYETVKKKAHQIDFEDLIRLPIELLKNNAEARTRFHTKWHYFLVDEFQDTNYPQLELLQVLVNEKHNVFVVGDDDQSIYGWRGAELQNLLSFESYFDNVKVMKLQKNYRSTQTIIDASNAVVHKNSLRRQKTVVSTQGKGEPIHHEVLDDFKDEMDWMIGEIKRYKKEGGLQWSDMAILVRTNIMVREVMQHLIAFGVPFTVRGANSLLDFPEVQGVFAYAKVLDNPNDELAWMRLLKFPDRGWPKNILEKMERGNESTLESLLDYLNMRGDSWSEDARKLVYTIQQKREELHHKSFYICFISLLQELKILEALEGQERKKQNVEEVLELFREECEDNPQTSLSNILNTLAYDNQLSTNDDKPTVKLMTIHASKGLEWDTVFLPCLDDDHFPAKKSETHEGIEEERRLFYVALTRAKRKLHLSWPATKIRYHQSLDVNPSCFVREIPEEYMDSPIGEKREKERKVFLGDIFADFQSKFGQEKEHDSYDF